MKNNKIKNSIYVFFAFSLLFFLSSVFFILRSNADTESNEDLSIFEENGNLKAAYYVG